MDSCAPSEFAVERDAVLGSTAEPAWHARAGTYAAPKSLLLCRLALMYDTRPNPDVTVPGYATVAERRGYGQRCCVAT